jgi:hypothetical protein
MPTFDNPFEGGGASNLPLAKVDSVRGALVCATVTPGQPRQWQTVPIGTRLVLDWGVRFYGGISFTPTVVEHVVLDGMPSPQIPENDGRVWQPVIKLPVLIADRGLFMGSFTGRISQNRIRPLLQLFELCPEAQKGLLQEYELHPFEPITLDKGTFHGLVLQPDGWIERDPAQFGPRLIGPPAPFLGGPAVPPKLSSGNDGATATPANDSAPSTAEPSPSPAANDPFGRYRPAGTNRKPY